MMSRKPGAPTAFPDADLMIFKARGGWFVRYAMRKFGPYPGGRNHAIAGAIETAQLAETHGKKARVREQIGPFRYRQLWPRKADAPKPKSNGKRRSH